ncbi:MAG: DNA polymerase III subunit beta [Bacteroidales bacterium]|jgi:DNA polymerase-3 subunit beta|nr:DNA polymerase III subunit beta [Bacteroidales bacterium]MBR6278176.1 DNA polymerase III subunit beta [Bacteroidales bacterium]
MKFVVSSTELLSRLQSVGRVINSKNTLPILDDFLFEVSGNTLTITASDLESTMRSRLMLDNVDGEGKIAIEAKRLTDILKEFPEQPLIFEINQETFAVVILSDNGKFSVVGQNADEYPEMKRLSEENTVTATINGAVLLKGIDKTIFATADDELRPVMNCIYLQFLSSGATFVASDTHKLVRYSNNSVNTEGLNNASFMLPKKPATMLKTVLAKETQDIILQFDDKNAYFQLSEYEMICRLQEGQYPNYEAVIPTNNPNRLTISRQDFATILKRVSVFSNSSNLIKLDIKSDQVKVTAEDIDFSISAEEKINAQYEGEDMRIGFKSSFLIAILNAINSENVVIQMSEPSRAGIIVPLEKESESEDELMLLMPIVTND